MAPPPVIEVAIGPVNGVNKQFTVSAQYLPGTLQVWLNGQLKRRDFVDGWVELGSNKFEMKEPPEVGDVVQVWFRAI